MQYYRAHWKAQGLTNRANNECRFGDIVASGIASGKGNQGKTSSQ